MIFYRRRLASLFSIVLIALSASLDANAASLTVSDGIVVKFGADGQVVDRDALVIGKGTAFTSQKDNQLGGNVSDGLGNPASGDWRGLRIEKSAASFGFSPVDSTIRYAGGGDNGAALTIRGFGPTLQYLQLTDSTVGLHLLGASSPTLTGLNFTRNSIGLVADESSRPAINISQFVQDTTEGVLNNTPSLVIQATGNWWGHSSGPRDSVGNPQGQGDSVSTGVNYGSYQASAQLMDPTLRLDAPASYFSDHTVLFDVGCINATDFRIAEGGNFSGVVFQSMQDGRAVIPVTLSSGDGKKDVQVQFRNAAGATTSATLTGVTVDTQAPTVAITNPSAGSVISAPITIEVAASDGYGIASVSFYIDGALKATDTSAPYNYSWNNDALADGAHSLRVVALDLAGRSAEQTASVNLSRTPPPPDTDGPTLTNLKLDGAALVDGVVVTRSGSISVSASDRSGVSRVELLVDGSVAATASGNGSYTVPFAITAIANGDHVVTVRALDSISNISTQSVTVTVTHAPPNAPTLSQPATGTTTRTAAQIASGTAQAGASIQVFLSGAPFGSVQQAGTNGTFAVPVTLNAGANQIQATASDQYGSSSLSLAININLDTSVPTPPSNPAAASKASGKIGLSWTRSSDANTVGYDVYRAATPFSVIGEATKISSSPITTLGFDDLPAQEGTYYYRIVSVNSAGTPSDPTDQVSAASDNTPPKATSIVYAPQGKTNPSNGSIGQGAIGVVLNVSERLQSTPYFAVVPQGDQPINVTLSKVSDTQYTGSFVIGANTASGIANALFSARDMAGNRGTSIDSGSTLLFDTQGPVLAGIALAPGAPIKNDQVPAITATFTLSEPLKSGSVPQISYLLSGASRTAVPVTGLSSTGGTTWTASFALPSDAGRPNSETFGFAYSGSDDLDNISTKISASNRFQVYQGDLPPLDVPLGLTAKALPGGKIQLGWQAVDGAAAYQIYRMSPTESTLQPYQRASGIDYTDQTTADGHYQYAVASIRQSNGQESLSGQSASVNVIASATAPGAPTNLALAVVSQGIKVTWQPAAGSVSTYNIYRASGLEITSLEGLTPYKTGVHGSIAVDATPSTTEHAYVVTALDAAGNESGISNSAYLNASLLPVTTLQVQQLGNNLPVVSWTASRTSVAGYNVYIGPDDNLVKQTASPTNVLSFTDNGYSSGERRYTVAATDANGIEVRRDLLLPNISTQIVSGLPISRGIMNRLQVQVTNTSSEPVSNAQLVIRLAGHEHRSEIFNLGANDTRLVNVVVGGYPDLPGQATADVSVEIVPNEGELTRISRTNLVDVGDSALVVGIATQEFTRGATGKVKLTIENTSDVDVELLTARSNGNSDELRFKILDADGNVLAVTPYKQVVGANVVTLSNGLTVARIAARASFTSDIFEMPVPASSPTRVLLKLEVDKLRYHTGDIDEVSIPGQGSERAVSLADTAYYGEVADVSPVNSFGDQDITISGDAIDRVSHTPLPNSRLRLILNQQGYERSFSVITDGNGLFTYTFRPTSSDSGLYKVSAIHPDLTDRPEQKAFVINKVVAGPTPYSLSVPRNYPFTIPFFAKAGPGASAHNLHLSLSAASQPTGQLPTGVTFQLPSPVSLADRQTMNIPVGFIANNDAQLSGAVIFDVVSDDHPASPIGQVRVNYSLSEAKPALFTTPSFVETGLAQGNSQLESVVVTNGGLQDALNLHFILLKSDGSPAPAWAGISSQADGTLAIGEKRSIDLSFAPPSGTQDGVYQFRLMVNGDNVASQSLNVFVSVTESGQGNVLFKASDIYTGTVDKNGNLVPGLAGATISMQNEDVATVSRQISSDGVGEALFDSLPAGSYTFRARASNHQEVGGRLLIKPGVTINQPIFLNYNLITVEWSVREVPIHDVYEVTLDATFETDVPAAVVVMQPSSVNLPKMNSGDVYYGELSLENHGLIRADNVHQRFPASNSFFRFEFLADVPSSLEAKQRVTIPYRVIALQSLDGSGQSSGGGCYNHSDTTSVDYNFKCSAGVVSNGSTSTSWFSTSQSSCGGGGGGGGGSVGGGGGWYSGPGGQFGGYASPATALDSKGLKCVFVPRAMVDCGCH